MHISYSIHVIDMLHLRPVLSFDIPEAWIQIKQDGTKFSLMLSLSKSPFISSSDNPRNNQLSSAKSPSTISLPFVSATENHAKIIVPKVKDPYTKYAPKPSTPGVANVLGVLFATTKLNSH